MRFMEYVLDNPSDGLRKIRLGELHSAGRHNAEHRGIIANCEQSNRRTCICVRGSVQCCVGMDAEDLLCSWCREYCR